MFIKIAAGAPPALEDAGNFKAFKVVSALAPEPARAALRPAGRSDGEHAWIEAAWLRAQGPAGDAAWQAGLEKMLQFAAGAGWVDEQGAVRAHIEYL